MAKIKDTRSTRGRSRTLKARTHRDHRARGRGQAVQQIQVWERREASWKQHDKRRVLDYEGEMAHAFSEWYGTPLCDLVDDDGSVFFVAIDPDPRTRGWIKKWRPDDELNRLSRVEHGSYPRAVRPEFAAFHSELDAFLRDPDLEKNLNYGEDWAARLCGLARAVVGNEVNRGRALWVLNHCLEQRDGSLD